MFKQGEKQWKVPAFWAGDKKWTVRFAPPAQGKYTYRVECSDKSNAGLNGKEQHSQVAAYTGKNPLLQTRLCQGRRRQASLRACRRHAVLLAGRYLVERPVQADDLGGFPGADGGPQGQGILRGANRLRHLIPMKAFSRRAGRMRAASHTRRSDSSVVNPKYFDYADRRIKTSGRTPAFSRHCRCGWGRATATAWRWSELADIKRHWRNLIARYGAYPVIWILGGETGRNPSGARCPWADVRDLSPEHRSRTITRSPANGPGTRVDRGGHPCDRLRHGRRRSRTNGLPSEPQLTRARLNVSFRPTRQNRLCRCWSGESCYEGHMHAGVRGRPALHVLGEPPQRVRRAIPTARRASGTPAWKVIHGHVAGCVQRAKRMTGRPGRKA